MRALISIVIASVIFIAACDFANNKGADTTPPANKQSDENFTGVKEFYEGEKLRKETTFKNGVKEGLNKNYYDDGRLKRTIWYENNLKEDTAKWYYTDGSVYRATPYKNDKIHGIQTKYHPSGRIMAKIPYKHGLRTSGLIEYYENGLEVGKIPSINEKISTNDYNDDGMVSIVLTLSNNSKNVSYYYGGLIDGAFDPNKAKDVTASTGMAYIELFRTEQGGKGYIDVVAEYKTRFRNYEIITKRIKLPYSDLK